MEKTKCWTQSPMLRCPAWGGSGRRIMVFGSAWGMSWAPTWTLKTKSNARRAKGNLRSCGQNHCGQKCSSQDCQILPQLLWEVHKGNAIGLSERPLSINVSQTLLTTPRIWNPPGRPSVREEMPRLWHPKQNTSPFTKQWNLTGGPCAKWDQVRGKKTSTKYNTAYSSSYVDFEKANIIYKGN